MSKRLLIGVLSALVAAGCSDDTAETFGTALQGFIIQSAGAYVATPPDESGDSESSGGAEGTGEGGQAKKTAPRLPQRFRIFLVSSCTTTYELASVNLYNSQRSIDFVKRDGQRFYTPEDADPVDSLTYLNGDYTVLARNVQGETYNSSFNFSFTAKDTVAPVRAQSVTLRDKRITVVVDSIATFDAKCQLGVLCMPYNEGSRPRMVDALICLAQNLRATDHGMSYEIDLSNTVLQDDHADVIPYCTNSSLVMRLEPRCLLTLKPDDLKQEAAGD